MSIVNGALLNSESGVGLAMTNIFHMFVALQYCVCVFVCHCEALAVTMSAGEQRGNPECNYNKALHYLFCAVTKVAVL